VNLPEEFVKLEWHQRPPDRSRELELLALLATHARREGGLLASYRKLAAEADNPGIRYLAGLVLEDEERHHRVLDEMTNSLRSEVDELDLRPSTPWLATGTDPEWHSLTGELLAFERQDAKDLRRLRKRLRRSPRSSLLPLVARMLALDTAKHIEILRFIRAHTSPR
jgi:hypothetical protein